MEEKRTYTVKYVALSGDIVTTTVEAENGTAAEDKVWEECSCGSSNDPLEMVDVYEGER